MKVEKALIELNEVRNDIIIAKKEDDTSNIINDANRAMMSQSKIMPAIGSGVGGAVMGAAATATSFKSHNNNYNMNFSGANFFINTSTSGFFKEGGGLLGNID